MKSIVKFDLENLGTEIWMVEHPQAARVAFDEGGLDDAAAAGGEAVVLRAHWGNDIPMERDDAWLDHLLNDTREEDREEARELVETWWEAL